MVRQNNDTRWNSTYAMIESAIRVQRAIDKFIVAAINESRGTVPRGERLEHDQLAPEHWKELEELEELSKLLEPFKWLTIEMQGTYKQKQLIQVILAMTR